MSWQTRYRLREFVASSFWLFPALALLLAWLVGKSVLWLVPDLRWPRFDAAEVEGMRVSLAAFASSMLTFMVYAVSALLLAVQLASGQTSPRLIRLTFGRWEMKASASAFVFAFGITLVALANTTESTRHAVLIALSIAANVAAIGVFFWFVEEVGLGLRPVSVLQKVFADGKDAMDGVYAGPFEADRKEDTGTADELVGRDFRLVRRGGGSGTFLAFGARELVALARQAGCTIELIPQVGDFVSTDDVLARLYPPEAAVDDAAINALVVLGPERTMRQDPMFAFRIMVDVASRALSPAVNDPTTAVLALDQVHRLLRYAGAKNLDNARVRDETGTLRLAFPTPNWADIVELAVTEVRQYGASSIQVARRLRAMLEHLVERLPAERAPTLRRELGLLERTVARSFVEDEDRRRAGIGDLQGLGGSSTRSDL
ncbi:MAG: DUF2254 domain-containing protein [Proteobacteria bacterium]|nr:DUF2254 domain-containing protein [Pseudomonadota bacterium]